MRGVQAEGQYRGYAIAGQMIADLNSGPLAAVLTRRPRTATVRCDLITMPARTARSGRGNLTLRLPGPVPAPTPQGTAPTRSARCAG
jgi:hypothetical protein